MFQKRVNQVIEKMKTDGLKQILVSEPCSIYYLTGVDVGPGERMFALYLNDEGRKVLFLNKRIAKKFGTVIQMIRFQCWQV